jgi:Na+-transporting methylmalonyl-CoA/oxaloacetate decarboxylase gamma subunit
VVEGQTTGLLVQGLLITVIGMGLVFAALGLLWGLVAILNRGGRASDQAATLAPIAASQDQGAPELTAERARVAAIAAAALLSSAVPLLLEPPVGPAFEHGRTAPTWVTTNRAISLQPWMPPRTEADDPRTPY